ncbi:MAG TPA: hypothetical protein VGK96_27170 [Candidatus Sulfotelmatobacter sp.]
MDPGGSTKSKNKAGRSGKGSSIACNAARYASAKLRVEKLNKRKDLVATVIPAWAHYLPEMLT